jgi:2-polyprenyl-6-methoxyphenol hydroxylase-like FAD-dependent oxidoreductase
MREDAVAVEGKRVLIIGGGFSGMAAAIQLRKAGASVDIVEIDPAWRSYGAGITLSGASLRALRAIGALEAFLEQGAAADGVDVFSAAEHRIASLPTPRLAGADVPGGGAIMRPALAAILAKATRACGASVRLGVTFEKIEANADGVHVIFSDGSQDAYDLAVAADGLYSKTRVAIFPEAPQPQYTGQCVWRAVAPRPPEIERPTMWLGHKVKVGVNPVSRDEMYMFVTEDRPSNDRIDAARFTSMLAELIAPFSSPVVQQVRTSLGERSRIVYRPLEALLMPRPWSRDRVVLIGDAAHATTPHLASGACIGIEDAIVLADEVERADSLAEALRSFESRRWERCRMVVENSVRLGEIEITGGDPAEHAAIMRESMMALAAPI